MTSVSQSAEQRAAPFTARAAIFAATFAVMRADWSWVRCPVVREMAACYLTGYSGREICYNRDDPDFNETKGL